MSSLAVHTFWFFWFLIGLGTVIGCCASEWAERPVVEVKLGELLAFITLVVLGIGFGVITACMVFIACWASNDWNDIVLWEKKEKKKDASGEPT